LCWSNHHNIDGNVWLKNCFTMRGIAVCSSVFSGRIVSLWRLNPILFWLFRNLGISKAFLLLKIAICLLSSFEENHCILVLKMIYLCSSLVRKAQLYIIWIWLTI
jgi:hypothetical protein